MPHSIEVETKMPSSSKLSRAACVAGVMLYLPLSASAEGLGDLRVKSFLGEVFQAEVEVFSMRRSFAADCILVDQGLRDPESGLARLRDVSVTVDAGNSKLLIRSRKAISDPAMQLSLTLACGSYLTRSYVILLSPREMLPASDATSGEPMTKVLPKAVPVPLPSADRPVRRKKSVPPSASSSPLPGKTGGETSAVQAAPVVTPLPAVPAAPAASGERLELSPPATELEQIEKEIAALHAELRRLASGGNAQSPETQTRILELETRLVRMELHAARARLQSQGNAGGVPPAAVSAGGGAVASSVAETSNPGSDSVKKLRRVEDSTTQGGGWWGMLGGGSVLLALLAAYFLRRAGARRHENPPSLSAAPASVADSTAVSPSPVSRPVAAPVPEPVAPPEFSNDMAEADELPPEAEVVKLAEVMSAFGRIDGAIEALRGFIREHPDRSLKPTLCLLKIYKEQGNRAAFEELAAGVRDSVGCGDLKWDDPVEEIQRLLSAAA